MFEAKLSEAGLLKKMIEAIKDLLTEGSLDCSENGIYLQAMDSSHVALVTFLLKKNAFESYFCDRNQSLGINMSSITKILKCCLSEDIVKLRTEDDSDVLTFTFESVRGEKMSIFEMKLMNLDIEHLNIPESEYSCVITMPSIEFSKITRDLSLLGDTITISCTKSGVNFITYGDLGNGNIRLKQSSNIDDEDYKSIDINLRKPVTLTFSLRYLTYFTKASPISDQVSLSMSDDVPLTYNLKVVEFKILYQEEEDSVGYVRYYLAPKVDTEY